MVSKILGPDGQPVDLGILREPQTAHASQLQREFQGHPSRGLTPSKLASILESAEQGDLLAQAELFEDMEEKDAHILAEMSKRRRALTQMAWQIVPPPNPSAKEKKAAQQLQELVAEIDNFESVLFDTTDAIGKGFVCQEIEWHQVEGLFLPKALMHRPQGWFRLFRGERRQEIRLRGNSAEGEVLNPFGWAVHEHKTKSGYLERASLFRSLVWPYLFKNYAIADLAEWLEIYGIPTRIGKYASGASENEKTTLLRALVQLGHNAAGIIPESASIELKDTATGDAKAFELMIDWCERSESKVILGATLTSQAGRGSNTNALGKVHDDVRMDLRDSDARQLAPTITRDVVFPIAMLNGLAESLRRCPRFVIATGEPEDMKTFADALPGLVKLGFKIRRSWAQEKVGIPEPEAGDEDLLELAPEPAPAAQPSIDDEGKVVPLRKPKPRAAARARAQASASSASIADSQAQALAEQLGVSMDDWLARVADLVESADSFEAIRDGLLALHPTLGLDQFAAAMRQAMLAAQLAGRYDVLEDFSGQRR